MPLLALVIVFAAAAIVPFVARRGRARAAWTSAGAMVAALLVLAPLMPGALSGEILVLRRPWLGEWGLDLALRFDGLGLLFAILILGIGILVVLYASYYMPAQDRLGRFFALFFLFAGGMLGIVFAENLLLLLIFWEITSLTSFLLIAYKWQAQEARIAARMALAVTGGGGLALFAGLLLLGHIAGSYQLSDVLARGAQIRDHPLYAPMLVLVLLGAFTKSAQFPFHFWLPNAMAAPTPVSAYLHSATMVKAGVFLLARLYPALSGSDLWFVLVSTVGAVTLVYGAYVALLKDDFKGLLAYSTISHLGLITLLLGLDTRLSPVAALFHIINHAIFKASLFMSAGIIDHECGTRDMRRINGLFFHMPRTAMLGIVAAGAMAGVPFLNGFLSKEMFFTETVAHPAFPAYGYLLPAFATIAGLLSAAYSARFIHDVFFNGEPVDLPRTPHEPPRWMRLPVEILVGLCLLLGLLPQFAVGRLLAAASRHVVRGELPPYELAIWHGVNLPLLMSAIALVGGILYYSRRERIFDLHRRYGWHISSPLAFERLYRGAARGAAAAVAALDGGSLQRYLACLLGFAMLLALLAHGPGMTAAIAVPPALQPVDPAAVAGFALLIAGCAGAVLRHRRRLLAVIATSVTGLVMALIFVRFAGPDLALTQIMVEVVTVMLLLLALRFLPATAPREGSRGRHLRDAALALGAGGGMAALAYAMMTRPFETISGFHLRNAVPGGGGTNAVNVILVDFRGFDTLGEIAVLAMAAIGVAALLADLRLVPQAPDASAKTDLHPVMLAILMRPLLPLALTVAIFILLRGHNLPGGGFIAGLVASVALILQYVANGIDFAGARITFDPLRLAALGLATALGTGLAAWLFAKPFLTSAHGHVHLPLIGDVELASAMLFDVGVFAVVLASVMSILAGFGRLSRDERPRVPAAEAEG